MICILLLYIKTHGDYSNGTNAKQESNPFEEEEWDEEGGEPLVDNGEPGVPVRALYDYEGAEADELSFKQGIIERMSFANGHFGDAQSNLGDSAIPAMFSKKGI